MPSKSLAHVPAAALLLISSVAGAATIFDSGDPFGAGGVSGVDICSSQAAAIRFTPVRDCSLLSCSLWITTDLPPGQESAPTLTVSLRAEGSNSATPGAIIESWTRGVTASGQTP